MSPAVRGTRVRSSSGSSSPSSTWKAFIRSLQRCAWCCVDVCRWIPVVFIAAIVLWSYYAYTYELCIRAVDDVFTKLVFLFFYHIIGGLFVWSYAATIFTHAGRPEKRYMLTVEVLQQMQESRGPAEDAVIMRKFAQPLPLMTRQEDGGVRYCKACASVKPDRCHHCSICRQCVLKMDHHCPWVNNCVGYRNYKFFVLFLFYATLYCVYVAATDIKYTLQYWDIGKSHENDMGMAHRMQIIFLSLVAGMFTLGVLCLFCYHVYLLLNNKTTIESFRLPLFAHGGRSRRGFGIGWRNNFYQVFGSNKWYWLLPVRSSVGDGHSFPVCEREESGSLLSTVTCSQDEDDEQTDNEVEARNHRNGTQRV